MFITREIITLIVPYILLVRTYDAVQLICWVWWYHCRDRHGSIRKNYVQRTKKDEVWRPEEKDYTSGVSITAGIRTKTLHALFLMRWAQHGKFVEEQ
jgi:hypothetical protein